MIKMRILFDINNKKFQRTIIANKSQFSCFALSEKNNLLVAGLQNHIFFFWDENCEWVFKQDLESIEGIDWVYSLSFNESENKLISCNGDNKIAIMQQPCNQLQQWKMVQIINMDNFVTQAIFFGNDSFIIHPWMSNNMLVYNFNQQSNVFTLSNSFLMEGEGQSCYSFSSLYIKYRKFKFNTIQNQKKFRDNYLSNKIKISFAYFQQTKTKNYNYSKELDFRNGTFGEL
ncbi:unnamed protein product [Paramecium pentaurelia]|uniref:WD40-repeat-containing domain n=1 Tax=Paramecium pentaurelia TaxID=43138 RepID=A0A8S1UCK4_9CILI|nr:unnamed protein product [Paramecium pentaurelia]